MAYAEADDLTHEPHSFITRYVWSQDHKVIAVQYASTAIAVGLVGLVLSNLMRLQIGFPGVFEFINPERYYQFVTMHGMIMVIYLLTALFLGGFGNYLIPLMVGARDMVFPYMNMHGGRFSIFVGGWPIEVDGEVVGGIGVSGGHTREDIACCKAGITALLEQLAKPADFSKWDDWQPPKPTAD